MLMKSYQARWSANSQVLIFMGYLAFICERIKDTERMCSNYSPGWAQAFTGMTALQNCKTTLHWALGFRDSSWMLASEVEMHRPNLGLNSL